MALLIEQLRKHCKAKGLHCMIFTEGEEENKYAIAYLKRALREFDARTERRKAAGIEGKHEEAK